MFVLASCPFLAADAARLMAPVFEHNKSSPPAIKGVLRMEEQVLLRTQTTALLSLKLRRKQMMQLLELDAEGRLCAMAPPAAEEVHAQLLLQHQQVQRLERCRVNERCFIPILTGDVDVVVGGDQNKKKQRSSRVAKVFVTRHEWPEGVDPLKLRRGDIRARADGAEAVVCVVGGPSDMVRLNRAIQWAATVYVDGLRCDRCAKRWCNGLTRCSGCGLTHYCSRECRLLHHRAHARACRMMPKKLPSIAEE